VGVQRADNPARAGAGGGLRRTVVYGPGQAL